MATINPQDYPYRYTRVVEDADGNWTFEYHRIGKPAQKRRLDAAAALTAREEAATLLRLKDLDLVEIVYHNSTV